MPKIKRTPTRADEGAIAINRAKKFVQEHEAPYERLMNDFHYLQVSLQEARNTLVDLPDGQVDDIISVYERVMEEATDFRSKLESFLDKWWAKRDYFPEIMEGTDDVWSWSHNLGQYILGSKRLVRKILEENKYRGLTPWLPIRTSDVLSDGDPDRHHEWHSELLLRVRREEQRLDQAERGNQNTDEEGVDQVNDGLD